MRLDSKHKTRLVATFGTAAALTLGATSVATAYGSPAASGEKQEVREASAQAEGTQANGAPADDVQGLGTQAEAPLDTQALGAKLEAMATQSTSTIAPGEKKTVELVEDKRSGFVFECEEDGLYTLSATKGEDTYVEYLVVSDVESKKPIRYISTWYSDGPLSFSAEAGKSYLLSACGEGPCTLSLAKHDSYKGSESFRITKVNGNDADEAYGLFTPITPGDTVEFQAEIPLWQLVSTETGDDPVPENPVFEPSDHLIDEKSKVDIEVALGEQLLEEGDDKDYDAQDPALYTETEIDLKKAGKQKLVEAFKKDPNATLTITVTISNVAEPMEGGIETEGMDGYPSWSGGELEGAGESEIMGPRVSCLTLSYTSAFDGQEVQHSRLLLDDALDLITLVTDENGNPVGLKPKKYVDEEADYPLVTAFERADSEGGSEEESYVVYLEGADGTPILPGTKEGLEEWLDGLEMLTGYDVELDPVCFRNVAYGTYNLVCEHRRGNEEPVVTRRQISVARDAGDITENNELGLKVDYDGAEVPFCCYGRLLSVAESDGATSKMPTLPFGTLNGAIVTLPIPQEAGPVAMKVERPDGSLADARTAAFGETVNFHTTAKLAVDNSYDGESMFTYTFPDSNLYDYGSDGGETKRPFEVSAKDVRVKATLADGTELELERADMNDREAYDRVVASGKPYFIAEYDSEEPDDYGDDGQQTIVVNVEEGDGKLGSLKGATLAVDVAAKLTNAVSCGGYGNVVKLNSFINGEERSDVNVVYTGTFILQTIDTVGNPLDGAEFTIAKEGAGDLKVGAVKGLSLHAVPEAVFTGDDSASNLKMVGHSAEETNGLEGESVGQGTGCLSYAGVEPGVYNLTETKFPQGGWRPRKMPQPIRLELTAHVPDTIVSGTEYCRWSVRLDGTSLPELLRYQMGLLDPALPDEAYLGSFIAYSCQSSTIVLRELHVQNDITAQVVWNDEGLESERPEYAHLQLTQNGNNVGNAAVVRADDWSNVWRSLESEKGANDKWSVTETNDWSVTEDALSALSAQSAQSTQSTQSTQSAQQGSSLSTASEGQRKYLTTYSDVEYSYNEQENEDSATITVTNTPILNVTFDSAGGSAVSAQSVVKGRTATEPAAPTRDGYTFEGWYLDEQAYDFSSAVDGDLKLVARWKKDEAVPTPTPTPEQKDDSTPKPTPEQKDDSTPKPTPEQKGNPTSTPTPDPTPDPTPTPTPDKKSETVTPSPAAGNAGAPTMAAKPTLPRTGDPAGLVSLAGALGASLLGFGAFRRLRK